MNTKLVYKAPDIFLRDAIIRRFDEHGIKTYGSDTSINIIYPETAHLYFGGASALLEGYRILVSEDDAEKASLLINEIEKELKELKSLNQTIDQVPFNSINDLVINDSETRRFYFIRFFPKVSLKIG